MIRIKLYEDFNFNDVISREEFVDFCETNLVYLLDESRFSLEILNGSVKQIPYEIYFKCSSNYNFGNDWLQGCFRWDEVSSDFIPFLELLLERFGMHLYIKVYTRLNGWENIRLDDLLNDDIKKRCDVMGYWWKIISITFY